MTASNGRRGPVAGLAAVPVARCGRGAAGRRGRTGLART